jgi:hypothetical protein
MIIRHYQKDMIIYQKDTIYEKDVTICEKDITICEKDITIRQKDMRQRYIRDISGVYPPLSYPRTGGSIVPCGTLIVRWDSMNRTWTMSVPQGTIDPPVRG